MSRIYIRHGEKLYHNNSTGVQHTYDAGLSRTDIGKMKELVEKLVHTYGRPDLIFCSPFERCRETALLLRYFLYHLGEEGIRLREVADHEARDTRIYSEDEAQVPLGHRHMHGRGTGSRDRDIAEDEEEEGRCPIVVDRYIGEYFGNLNLVDMSEVRSETAKYQIFIDRNTMGLQDRISQHLYRLAAHEEKEVIWLITHGSVASGVSKVLDLHPGRDKRRRRENKIHTLGHVHVPRSRVSEFARRSSTSSSSSREEEISPPADGDRE